MRDVGIECNLRYVYNEDSVQFSCASMEMSFVLLES